MAGVPSPTPAPVGVPIVDEPAAVAPGGTENQSDSTSPFITVGDEQLDSVGAGQRIVELQTRLQQQESGFQQYAQQQAGANDQSVLERSRYERKMEGLAGNVGDISAVLGNEAVREALGEDSELLRRARGAVGSFHAEPTQTEGQRALEIAYEARNMAEEQRMRTDYPDSIVDRAVAIRRQLLETRGSDVPLEDTTMMALGQATEEARRQAEITRQAQAMTGATPGQPAAPVGPSEAERLALDPNATIEEMVEAHSRENGLIG